MIFVDTGPLLARWIARDQHHAEARRGWQRLAAGAEGLTTSNFVLDELATLLARTAGYAFAAERLRGIYASSAIAVVRPDAEDEIEALDWFEKYAGQAVSFTDCVSFALMRRRRIAQAFSFDRHFPLAGFPLWGRP